MFGEWKSESDSKFVLVML